jgi:hypothetical protein
MADDKAQRYSPLQWAVENTLTLGWLPKYLQCVWVAYLLDDAYKRFSPLVRVGRRGEYRSRQILPRVLPLECLAALTQR